MSRVPHLISPEWLAEHLEDPDVVILEVAFHPPGSPASEPGRIPRSMAIWWKDLCWDETDRQFPDPATMAARLEELGVSDDTTLVLAGDPVQFATYAYWVMTMTGLDGVAGVLDGGLPGWRLAGRPTVEESRPSPRRGKLSPGTEDQSPRVGRDVVLAGLDRPGRVLVDLRSGEEYRGERVAPATAPYDHGAERKGRIPGAAHLPHDRLLDQAQRFRTPAEIEDELDRVGADASADVVTYCRLSHRASLGWFAATRLAGRDNVRVYDGSWTEWGSIVGYPIER
ncbi:MAG: sulfurtransferase [Actinomycetota bacterium]